MSEFNNRIAAQREVLSIVNSFGWGEELFGLSSGAIDRWISSNNSQIIPPTLIQLIRETASQLFFLANKSQEQITGDYLLLSQIVRDLTAKISVEISRIKLGNL